MKATLFVGAMLAAALSATAATAQAPTGYYVATPTAAPDKPNFVTRTTVWRAQAGAYVAPQAPERAEILCQLVAAKAGTLTGFSVKGRLFDTDQLAACNAKAAK